MGIRWLDVSIPIRPGMALWPGDGPVEFTPTDRIAQGDGCNKTRLGLESHTGTHCDAPWHFEDDGKRLHQVDSSTFFGEALVVAYEGTDHISAADIQGLELPDRVVFRTRCSGWGLDEPFREDYIALEPDAAQLLVDSGVRLVGVDYLSVAPFRQEGQDTHHILLRNDVFIVEGLRLDGVEPGIYPFVALPLPLDDLDGAPCRAFLGVPDSDA